MVDGEMAAPPGQTWDPARYARNARFVADMATLAESFTSALPRAQRPAFIAQVCDLLRPDLCDAQGRWTADYVRLRFAAVKPGGPLAAARVAPED